MKSHFSWFATSLGVETREVLRRGKKPQLRAAGKANLADPEIVTTQHPATWFFSGNKLGSPSRHLAI